MFLYWLWHLGHKNSNKYQSGLWHELNSTERCLDDDLGGADMLYVYGPGRNIANGRHPPGEAIRLK